MINTPATANAQRIKDLLSSIRTSNYARRQSHTLEVRKSAFDRRALDVESRQFEIEQLVLLSREAGRSVDETVGLAALISEIARRSPDTALELWKNFSIKISSNNVLTAVAYRGLSDAYGEKGNYVRSRHFSAAAEMLIDELGDSEVLLYRELAGLAHPENSVSPVGADLSSRATPGDALAAWLRMNRQLTIGMFGSHFGQFTTSDVSFVESAESLSRFTEILIAQRLSKPANYLLQASPGAGKSHFVRQFAARLLGEDASSQYLERNLSAYASIDQAFHDIVLDVLLAIARHKPVLLFVDEVDTEIGGQHIFQKLIAPMNGDDFFFQGKSLSFAKQNLVVCFALSATRDKLVDKPKWPDFLSRIPSSHQISLPSLDVPKERVVRALGALARKRQQAAGPASVTRVSFQALLYLGLNSWASARELDQAIDMALLRAVEPEGELLLEHFVQDVELILSAEQASGTRILGVEDFTLEVQAKPGSRSRAK